APLRRRAKRKIPRDGGELVVLSARAESDLNRLSASYAEHLMEKPFDLADVAFTASTGRTHHLIRAAIVAEDMASLVARLKAFSSGDTTAGTIRGSAPAVEPGVGFLFTGQGAQRAGMGLDLYRTEPVFKQVLDQCASVL